MTKFIMAMAAMCLVLGLFSMTTAQGQTRGPVEVLDGVDPVLLTRGKEVQGELGISVTRGQFKYLFATAENKALFEKDPARYEIQLGGACARMGAPVTGNPNLFTVHEGRIYIFGTEECKTRFVATPEKFLDLPGGAAANTPATPEALKRGRALVEKAVAAIGGASRLDGMASYREKSSSIQTRGRLGEVDVKNDLIVVFPDRIRREQVMPDYQDSSTMMRQTLLIVPGESYGFGARGTRVMPARVLPKDFRDQQEQEFKRNPLGILRARKDADFRAIAVGAGKAGETAVEHVAVNFGGKNCVLGIDTATGRILSLSYRRRGPEGSFGQLVQVFSDFRTVDGLTLPFKISATFDGQPWKDQSVNIEEITINGKVDPAVFEKPGTN